MKIKKKAMAGTLESSDALIEIAPGDSGIDIDLESVVIRQFGEQIRQSVGDVLRSFDIDSASVRVVDHGAIDCVLRARVETAVRRGLED